MTALADTTEHAEPEAERPAEAPSATRKRATTAKRARAAQPETGALAEPPPEKRRRATKVKPAPEPTPVAVAEPPAPKRKRAPRKAPKVEAYESPPPAEELARPVEPAAAEPFSAEMAVTDIVATEVVPEQAPVAAEQPAPDGPAPIALAREGAEQESGFAPLGLSPELLRAIEEKGYRDPTPIQAQAIPVVLMGRDVLGTAQTGTGKTASFVLPMMDILSQGRSRARMPRSLILEPTRELALQVAENFVQYGKYQKLTHALLIGGESLSDQKETLMRGVDVLIATPGRLMDMFERGGLLLTDSRILVIDEADRMLDMGFIPDVEKIVGFLPRNRQTLFFSATMAPEIRRLADAFLTNPKEIAVSRPASVASTIVAGLTVVPEREKREALRRLIRSEDVQNALIFCNRKVDVDTLYKSLRKHGFSVGPLHGDMSQPERFATLGKFKAGDIRLLVCSDVAARGLDIGGLSHVFNFDVPIHAEDYVHRIGRTGRAGMTGHAFTLATPDDQQFVDAIEKLVGAPIPRMQVEGIDPAEWSEDGGRRRGRGRSRGREPERAAKPAREPRQPRADAQRAHRDRRPEPPPPALDASQLEIRQVDAEPARDDPTRPDRGRSRRGGRRDESRSTEARRDDRSRDERPRDRDRDRPREGRRREEDLGPNVIGFGDDIPAFMLLRSRRQRQAAPLEGSEQEG